MITMAACDESCLTCTTESKWALTQMPARVVMLGKDSPFLAVSACVRVDIDRGTFLALLRPVQFALLAVARMDCNHGMM